MSSDEETRQAAEGAVDVRKGTATPEEIAAAVAELDQYTHDDRSDLR